MLQLIAPFPLDSRYRITNKFNEIFNFKPKTRKRNKIVKRLLSIQKAYRYSLVLKNIGFVGLVELI